MVSPDALDAADVHDGSRNTLQDYLQADKPHQETVLDEHDQSPAVPAASRPGQNEIHLNCSGGAKWQRLAPDSNRHVRPHGRLAEIAIQHDQEENSLRGHRLLSQSP